MAVFIGSASKRCVTFGNLLAKDTREGDVYFKLLEKLEEERKALEGKVFDVLGQVFNQKPLHEMLMEAIRYGDQPEVKARLEQQVEGVVDREHLQAILDERSLTADTMDTTKVQAIREEIERAHARRLQPHFIEDFFLKAFPQLGGKIHRRESGRYEITRVPMDLLRRDRQIGMGAPLAKRYERVCFDKEKVDMQPRAELVCPGQSTLGFDH